MKIDVHYREQKNGKLIIVVEKWTDKRAKVIQLLGKFFDVHNLIDRGVIPMTSRHTDILFFADVPRDEIDRGIGWLLGRGIHITMVEINRGDFIDIDNDTGHEFDLEPETFEDEQKTESN